jgi:hypothetical protein
VLGELWGKLLAYLQRKPYWGKLEPAAAFLTLLLAVLTGAYEYIQWQYHLSLPIGLFLQSYLVEQIVIGFLAFAALSWIFGGRPPQVRVEEPSRPARWPVRLWRAIGIKRLASSAAIIIFALFLLVHLAPSRVGRIRVRFLKDPGGAVDKYALAYLLYELNKEQNSWQFEVDFDPFQEQELTTTARALCEGHPLCLAEQTARGAPFVGITTEPLGEAAYWQNHGNASVITTARFTGDSAPNVYEYLAYTLIVQSILIHLNTACGGRPPSFFQESRVATGDLFDFNPRLGGMRAQILAGHLTPEDQALLLRCFGVEYMNTCSRLIDLDWMRGKKVTENLKRAFGVGVAAPPAAAGSSP